MANEIVEAPTCSIKEFLNTSFDYIVCGGGTAGCTIAARLTENPNVTVGLIEAGKSRLGDPVVDVPAMFGEQFQNPEYDWCIYSEPQVRSNMAMLMSGLNQFVDVSQRKGIVIRFTRFLAANI